MKIGFTYDLRKAYLAMGFSEEETAEFDSDETINSIEQTLQSLGHDVYRIGNIYELTKQLASGNSWDIVFNISEGLHGVARESQVPALLDAYKIPYTFSGPLTLAVSLDKAVTKKLVLHAGVPTPKFTVIRALNDIGKEKRFSEDVFPLFVKPLSEGTGKGITSESIVWDIDELKRQCKLLLHRYDQPVLAEEYLSGREFTAGILGTGKHAECIGVMQIMLGRQAEPDAYTYMNKELYEQRVTYSLVKDKALMREASEIALKAYRALDCRDGGRVDLKADEEGRLYFLEINPLAGLHPVRSDLSILCGKVRIPYRELISRILDSALQRVTKIKAPVPA